MNFMSLPLNISMGGVMHSYLYNGKAVVVVGAKYGVAISLPLHLSKHY